MSAQEATYHVTKEDLRKAESRESKKHGGQIPTDSNVSAMKVCTLPPSLPPSPIHPLFHISPYDPTYKAGS